MPDPARDLFEQFRTGAMARIDESVAVGEEEGPAIDFKENRNKSGQIDARGVLDEHGRRVLAKAMSAFANAGGGVIVWGIEARNEAATAKHPIPNVAQFRLQLEENTPKVVAPPLDRVEHIAIEDPAHPGAGYAVTYVPDGKVKPHMSTAKDLQTYFLRSGASSVLMPDAAVRAFVVAGARPSLAIEAVPLKPHEFLQGRIVMGGTAEEQLPMRIKVSLGIVLTNDGTALAERPAVALEKRTNVSAANVRDSSDTTMRDEGIDREATLYRLDYADPIYPGASVRLVSVEATVVAKEVVGGVEATQDVEIRYWAFARDFSSSGTILIPRGEIRIVPLVGYRR